MKPQYIFAVLRDTMGDYGTEIEGAYFTEKQAEKVAERIRAEGYEGVEVYETMLVPEEEA